MPHRFGEKLRYLRREQQLTQRDLTQQLASVRQAHVANLELNKRGPSVHFVIQVAIFFLVTTDYLLRDALPVEDAAAHPLVPSVTQASLPLYFGAKLRHLRKQADMRQTRLAQQLGLQGHTHISFLESGRHEPSVELVVQISDIFSVTTDYLLWDAIPIA
jgi:transcriptional regulator with XRE-family HTH domain